MYERECLLNDNVSDNGIANNSQGENENHNENQSYLQMRMILADSN